MNIIWKNNKLSLPTDEKITWFYKPLLEHEFVLINSLDNEINFIGHGIYKAVFNNHIIEFNTTKSSTQQIRVTTSVAKCCGN